MATKNTEPLIASLHLRYTETDLPKQPVEHFVYGSSLYGTLFGVFARVIDYDSDLTYYRIKTLSLRIVNYTGAFNIGFVTRPAPDLSPCYEKIDEEHHVFFDVQGLSSLRKVEVNFVPPLEVHADIPEFITFNRMLNPLVGFGPINGPLADRSKPIPNGVPAVDWFDTEFNSRNGVDLYFNPFKPGMLGYKIEEKFTMPSLRCHTSIIRLLY